MVNYGFIEQERMCSMKKIFFSNFHSNIIANTFGFRFMTFKIHHPLLFKYKICLFFLLIGLLTFQRGHKFDYLLWNDSATKGILFLFTTAIKQQKGLRFSTNFNEFVVKPLFHVTFSRCTLLNRFLKLSVTGECIK